MTSTSGSRRSISSLLPQLAARSLQGGYRPFQASGLLTRRRLWRPLAMRGALLGHATFPPGSALCRDRRPPAADLGCSASPSAATNICAPLLIHGARAALPLLLTVESPL